MLKNLDFDLSVFNKAKNMKPYSLDKTEFMSCYRISMWKFNEGKMPLLLTESIVSSPDFVMIFRNEIYYSHDGHYIFFII